MIRRATVDDVEEIARLYERSFATLDFLPVLHTLDEHRHWFGKQLAEHEGWVWDEGGVRGFSVLTEGELMYLYLDVGWTGRGIGSKLLEHAKQRRPGGFTLWTFQQNEGARRFYERHGLVPVEFTDGEGNEERTPDVRYAWRSIRRATPDDVEEIFAIFDASFRLLDFLPQLHTRAEGLAFIGRCVRDGEAYVLGRGFAILAGSTLTHLYVHPDEIGTGVGHALFEHVKTQRPEGFDFWVFQQNARARRFYEAHGAVAVEFTDGEGNEEKTPDVRYAWKPSA